MGRVRQGGFEPACDERAEQGAHDPAGPLVELGRLEPFREESSGRVDARAAGQSDVDGVEQRLLLLSAHRLVSVRT